jgi:acetyl/propionyl-CoA carboxylase alpha subunit
MSRPRRFEKVAIANRGEVAVRIIHACQELGLETILLHSSVDENTLAFRLADHKVCIGEAASSGS